ncbi:hypothetical protein LWI29_013176 [Acer saccharum]|uniref:TF-B3 domain-containing protein n=1 Tax=Acer saccharum TaxID=4024 RepID=A0AA39RLU6_ACESA|nr:hypothetical protein LWI29_013176 [Acer saccharum]
MPTHFSTVIVSHTLQDKKLSIPKEFVKKLGDELSDFATIIVPDGRVWRMGVSKDVGKNFFHHGWQDFVENHSISVGHFLLFRYDKNSTFHALIFDTSTFEISYPKNFIERGVANLGSSSSKHELELPRTKCKMEEHMEVNANTAHNGEDEHPTRMT